MLWWIGTPVLLPFTLIGALAILFRTRRMWLGAIFVVGGAADLGRDVRRSTGQTFPDGVE